MPTFEFLNRDAKFSPFQNYPKSTGAVKIMASLDTSDADDDGKCMPGEFVVLNSAGNFQRVVSAALDATVSMGNLYVVFDGNSDKIGHYWDESAGQNISNGILAGSAMGLGSNFTFKLARVISGSVPAPGDRCTVEHMTDANGRVTTGVKVIAKPVISDGLIIDTQAVLDYSSAPLYCNGIAEDGAYIFTII